MRNNQADELTLDLECVAFARLRLASDLPAGEDQAEALVEAKNLLEKAASARNRAQSDWITLASVFDLYSRETGPTES